MKLVTKIINKIKKTCNWDYDLEMNAISKIITQTPKKLIMLHRYNNLMRECDQVFIDRLEKNKAALKLNFWESHFELNGFKFFPEISGHLLDFGCGSGHLDILLTRSHPETRITGIDASPIGINICKFYYERESEDVRNRLNFLEIDVTKPKEADILCDCAWSTQVFEHISEPSLIISGVRNYVKPGGLYLICVPFGNAYNDPGHCNHFYSEKELFDFLCPHIEVERIIIDSEFEVIRALCRL